MTLFGWMLAASLFAAPPARMHLLLEKTVLKLQVLTIDVRFDADTARDIEALVQSRSWSADLEEPIARRALQAREVDGRVRFLRGIGQRRFLKGVRDNMKKAMDAGIITREQYNEVASGLPTWYAFLEGRGVRKGDVMRYRISGDELRVEYVGADGKTLMDHVDHGAGPRLTLLGSWFARGTEFRAGLIRSLFR